MANVLDQSMVQAPPSFKGVALLSSLPYGLPYALLCRYAHVPHRDVSMVTLAGLLVPDTVSGV